MLVDYTHALNALRYSGLEVENFITSSRISSLKGAEEICIKYFYQGLQKFPAHLSSVSFYFFFVIAGKI